MRTLLSAPRDPRIAPISGDILRSAAGRERHVNSVHGGDEISYRSLGGGGVASRNVCSLRAWRFWCAQEKAEVVELGATFG
jgi:hypothetical protein